MAQSASPSQVEQLGPIFPSSSMELGVQEALVAAWSGLQTLHGLSNMVTSLLRLPANVLVSAIL